MDTAAQTQTRTQRLFQFLQEFTQLKFKPQRTSKEYTLLWLHSLPQEREIFNAARITEREASADEWVVIRKPKFHLAPPLLEALKPWVEGAPTDPAKAPEVRTQIVTESEILDDDLQPRTIKETLFLDQQAEVQKLWASYQRQWQEWASEERRARSVQERYSQLFAIHQSLNTFGETYELRLGLGYLVWQTPSGHEVRRHLLTARAALSFDALRGVLSVTAAGDGARTALEQDMLDPGERPLTQVQDAIQAVLAESGEELWTPDNLPGLLKRWVNAAGERGDYQDDLTPPRGVTAAPVVHWAPALILRRRGERSLTAAYGEIIAQIKTQHAPPANLRDFVDKPPDTSVSGSPEPREPKSKQELYFPLPANDAQMEIIRRLGRQRGVLVQGPPGTGKSHTIVNLVSHLLATDQRVLVTSHTARALKVLREKFPANLAGLCVTHLRGEEGARAMLESSVGEILQRSTRREPWREQEQLEALARQLEQARQEEDHLLDELRVIRQAETDTLDLYGYAGTAQSIGERLRDQEETYDWLSDLGDPTQNVPLIDPQATRLLALLRDLTDVEVTHLAQRWPAADTLVTPETFIRVVQAETQAQERADEQRQARAHPAFALLDGVALKPRNTLVDALHTLIATIDTERQRPQVWMGDALDALLKGQVGLWKEVQTRSDATLPELLERADFLEQTRLSGTEGHEAEALRQDAQTVLDHLKGGGNWGGIFGKPQAVKTRLYLRETVKVAGQPAQTPEVLGALLEHLRLSQTLAQLEEVWATVGVKGAGPLRLRLVHLDEQRSALDNLTQLGQVLQAARQAVQAVPGLPQPQWWDRAQLQALLGAAQAVEEHQAAQARRQVLEDLLPTLSALAARPETHPVVKTLERAVLKRDAQGYAQAVLQIQQLESRKALWTERQALDKRLRAAAPSLADELTMTSTEPHWEARLGAFEAAWRWTQADARLTVLADPDTEVEMRGRLAATRERVRLTLGELASTRAWSKTLDRVTKREQMALVRWQEAVRKLGKGTGKRAEQHRRTAREALEDARSAIPAWIMPLQLVAETFGLQPDMFDVVIVDEASQAGPEALFLTYIAKKIIIVGDNKQIEPESVGIQTERVDALVAQYLHDFPAPETVGERKASLFGFGAYTYAPMISLSEHFRCMPEIIKFSSDLSYPEPLIALRQFGADRLKPLMPRHITDGFTIQRGDKVNPAEARAIVDQIKACLASPRYAGKSFGVISLVGDSQAEEINALLRSEVPEAELEERRLICGNAYSFQGDERDVIFLSMVDSPTDGKREPKRSRDNEIFQPRYNVAVSRARDQLWLFHSVDLSDLAPDDLRASLISHVRSPELAQFQPLVSQQVRDLREQAARPGRKPKTQPAPFDSWFEVDVYLSIVERGYRVVPKYKMNNYRIDLVVEGMRGRLAVECDGDEWHGADQYSADLHRQQTLERSGMEFWRVRGSTYARDPEAALEDLWRTLDKRGVFPEGDPRNFVEVENVEPEPSVPVSAQPLTASPEATELAESAGHADQENAASEVVELELGTSLTSLEPYLSWAAHTLPDPRQSGSMDQVEHGLSEIIGSEGPMTCQQAYRIYAKAAGLNYGKAVQSAFNKAVARALRAGKLTQADEWGTPGQIDKVVRLAGAPPVRLRERGPRDLSEIPPLEVRALMDSLTELEPDLGTSDPEPLFRRVLATYGMQRLTIKSRTALEHAFGLGQG